MSERLGISDFPLRMTYAFAARSTTGRKLPYADDPDKPPVALV